MLLPATKTPLLERVYAAYGRRLLRAAFAGVHVGGAPWPDQHSPVIAFVNHSAWWDPILALYLSHDLYRRDGYGIMSGAGLQQFPFFRRIGCFGTTTHSREDARAIAGYARRLLTTGRGRALWIFPQGELLPPGVPLRFRSGAARLALAVPEARLVPVAVRYLFGTEQRPECLVRIGEAVERPGTHPAGVLTGRLEAALRGTLARLDADITARDTRQYTTTLQGRRSLSHWYGVLREAVRGSSGGGEDRRGDPVLRRE